MNDEKLKEFMRVYVEELLNAVSNYPQEYGWPISQVPIVADRMHGAIIKNSFNKDSRAFKATCKRLGIKHTYQEINKFLGRAN